MSLNEVFLKYASGGVVAGIMGSCGAAQAQNYTVPSFPTFGALTKSSVMFDPSKLKLNSLYLSVGEKEEPWFLESLQEFCAIKKEDCGTSDGITTIPYSKYANVLKRVNLFVNKRITYRSDQKSYGINDKWVSLPLSRGHKNYGDCEDYVLTKRDMLSKGVPIKDRIPLNAMMIAYVKSETGGPHAVLVVRTTNGDKVLDNRHKTIMSLQQTLYDFQYVTDPADQAHWRVATYYNPSIPMRIMPFIGTENGFSLMEQYKSVIAASGQFNKAFEIKPSDLYEPWALKAVPYSFTANPPHP